MRIKDGFVLRDVAGHTMVIATGEASESFHGMIKLNDTAKRVWQGLFAGQTPREIAKSIAAAYDVTVDTALNDVNTMIDRMTEAGFLCE